MARSLTSLGRKDWLLLAGVVAALAGLLLSGNANLAAQARAEQARQEVEELRGLLERYQAVRPERGASLPGDSPVSLATLFEDTAAKQNLRASIASMSPAERTTPDGLALSTLSVSLRAVSHSQLVQLLTALTAAPQPLSFPEYSIERRFDNPEVLDVSLSLAMLAPAGDGGS